jgi:hypothetical protein
MKEKSTGGSSASRGVSSEEYLAAAPHVNVAAEVKPHSQGGAIVAIPLRRPGWMVPPLSWILPYSSHRRIRLDEVGYNVLRMCDGTHTVESIIEKFAAVHKLSFREAQVPVTDYLRQLTQRGLVVIVGPKETQSKT